VAESNLHPGPDVQKRRSTRIVQAVPLTVTGVDALGRPFQERTSTLIINCHGARYQSKHYVLKNMWVTLEVPHNEPGREPRQVRGCVTWIQRPRTVRELFQIGVQLEVCGNVWGIAFPPSDWFAFPDVETEPKLEIPAPSLTQQHVSEAQDWSSTETSVEQEPAPAPVESNLRVLPMPGATDASMQLARQVARLIAEAKQQIQSATMESASQAVAAETGPMLAAMQSQLQDALEQSVAASVLVHIEKSEQEALQRLQNERDTGAAAMIERLSGELDSRLKKARLQMDAQIAEVERARRADFEQHVQNQLQMAAQKMESLTGSMGANQSEVGAIIDQLRQSSEQAVADAHAHLAQMEDAAKGLAEQIAATTTIGSAGWRGLLESDLAAASARWAEKVDATIEDASRRTAEQIEKSSEVSARKIEQELQQRISLLGNSQSLATAEAETILGALRGAINRETSRVEGIVSQARQSIEQLEASRADISALLQSASEELAQRGASILEAQEAEMNRRAESAVAAMAQRLNPMLEAAGQETIEKLANELEEKLAPQIALSAEMLNKIAFDRDQAEKAIAEHQQRIRQVSDLSLQDTAARSKDLLAQIEKDFGESSRTASARWLEELETKATETSHITFEALFKSAEWYEKKVQTQMQTTLDKGLDQAATRMREKAAEMSTLFANELDHYSRTYVEHARGQMQESARDAAEQGSQKIAESSETAAAIFTERAAELGHEQFDLYASKTKSAFEQHTANMEAHTTQIRSKLESDARGFANEFQRVLSQHAQQTLAQGKLTLSNQVDQAKDALLAETQSLGHQFQASLGSQATAAMNDHKQRLDNASNSWLLTTVTKLNQQSENLITEMADATEKRLKDVCSNVFAEMGESLRQRLAGLAAPLVEPATPASPAPGINPVDFPRD